MKKQKEGKTTQHTREEIQNIVGYEAQYDLDNKKEYAKAVEAADLLLSSKKKGFKKAKGAELQKASDTIRDYQKNKGMAFLEEQKTRSEYYGMEIKAYFDKEFFDQNGLIKPTITIADFNPNKEIPKMKPWSEALEENLATRINCSHELNEDETTCKACGLNPENWGENNEGVSNEYNDRQREKIEVQKGHEKACDNGEHVLNDEAIKDDKAPMQFCVHCRLPKDKWAKEEKKA